MTVDIAMVLQLAIACSKSSKTSSNNEAPTEALQGIMTILTLVLS